MQELEATVGWVADLVQVVFEAASVLVVAAGGGAFIMALLARKASNASANARHVLARYLIVALELQLAADIIATATAPSLQEIGKLAAIALIRTFLNYFLVAEIRAEQKVE
jgi:uncharacterized membrane protein